MASIPQTVEHTRHDEPREKCSGRDPLANGMPVNGRLPLVYALSAIIAVTLAAAAAIGLINAHLVYPTAEAYRSFFPTDIANIAVGLPLLLLSMWLAWRGNTTGLLCWGGGLFFVLYSYAAYLIGVPFGVLFLPYAALVALSACALVALFVRIDHREMARYVTKTAPVKTSAGILGGLGLLIVVRQIGLVATALEQNTGVGMHELALWIADLTIAVPALIASGVMLWRRAPAGYAAGAGLLLSYGALSIGLVPVMIMQARMSGSPVDVVGVVVVLVMAALCLIPFGFFLRGISVRRGRSGSPVNDSGQ